MLSVLPLLLPGLGVALFLGDCVDVIEITRTELPTGTPVAPYGFEGTEVEDLNTATEQVTITFVNGDDATGAPVPFTCEEGNVPSDGLVGTKVVINNQAYAALANAPLADNPAVNVTGAAA